MIYRGEFKDINNEFTYRVDFKVGSSNVPVREIKLSGNDPIIITNDTDNLFEPIKTQSATIKLYTYLTINGNVRNNYIFDLYNAGYDVPVTIYQIDSNNNEGIMFIGYVTPNVYNQTWDYIDEIEVQCVSDLAMLKYRDYETIENSGKQIKSMYNIIKNCLTRSVQGNYGWQPLTRYNELKVVSSNVYNIDLDGNGQGIPLDNDGMVYILNHIYLDEINFFDDNEEQTPWKYYDVLEEIMKIMGCSLVETCGILTMIHYDEALLNTRNIGIYDLVNDTTVPGEEELVEPKIITKDLYFSSDNDVSLDETYRKIKVKANTYPYEEVFNEILNPDKWKLSSKYDTLGRYPSDNRYVPSWDWLDKDRDMHHGYFLYFESNKIKPYSYDNNNGTLTPTQEQDYIPVLIDNMQAQRRGNYRVGCGLMKLAMYKTEDYSVTNKLDWKPQIVFYTGVNTFNIADYGTPEYSGDRRSDTKRLQDHVNEYMEYNFGQWGSGNNWLPWHPLLQIKSESQINVSSDSYLIIGGKMCVNDLEWEGSVKEEWAGSDAFKQPTAYKLYDATVDYPNNRNWIGFPILQLQIRVGNPDTPASHKILCSAPELSEGTQIGMVYKWLTVTEFGQINDPDIPAAQRIIPYDSEHFWSCYIEVPVGAEKFSFFKFYDITNTCDWRLGLDDANGFAIPMPASAELTGTMMIYVVGPVPELYYLYVPDIRKLPTTSKEYVYNIQRNPYNIWNNGWSQQKSSITIENRTIGGLHYSYNGVMPSTILVQDLKFDIKEVTYHTYSDTVLNNSNNKKTDQEYENIINGESVVDAEDIECKINTQDLSKFRSFSSLMFKDSGNNYQYITRMSTDGGTNYRIQENNIIQSYKDHYDEPKVKFNCDIKDHFGITEGYDYVLPQPQFYLYNSILDKNMFINGFEYNLKNADVKLKLIEY